MPMAFGMSPNRHLQGRDAGKETGRRHSMVCSEGEARPVSRAGGWKSRRKSQKTVGGPESEDACVGLTLPGNKESAAV